MNNYCILAGGCFWCVAMPFYEKEGVNKVISGYAGGKEINPTYEDVKLQKTSHREVIKIEYNDEVISFEELLDIYFSMINPFDDGGQFIDRGNSYTTAIFFRNNEMKSIALSKIKDIENKFQKEVKVKLIKETNFYEAEEYHQEYGLKNPLEIEKEFIESGRKNKLLG